MVWSCFFFSPHYFTLCFIWKLSSSVLSLLCLPALENFWGFFSLISVLLFQQRSAKWQCLLPFVPLILAYAFPRQWFRMSPGVNGRGSMCWSEFLRCLGFFVCVYFSITVLAVVRSAAHHFSSFSAAPRTKQVVWPAQNCDFTCPVACVHAPSCQNQGGVLHVALAWHDNPRTFCISKTCPKRENLEVKNLVAHCGGGLSLAGR